VGGNLLEKADISEEECSCLCNQNAECRVWTYIAKHKNYVRNCWLKKEIFISKMTGEDWANSGIKNCMCTDENCVKDQIEFEGDTIDHIFSAVLTKENCSCSCEENANCTAWSFITGEFIISLIF
jgi:hypothetical protein